jgi:transposase
MEHVQLRMRGNDQRQSHVFSYLSPEQRVRKDHPLRPIRTMVDDILKQLSPQFNRMYAKVGRPSIPPEQLLRAQLLQMFYSVRSERLLMEELASAERSGESHGEFSRREALESDARIEK